MAQVAAQSLVIALIVTILSCPPHGAHAQACSNTMEEQDSQWPSHYTQPTRNLVCPDGWTHRGRMCYQPSSIPQTWAKAQQTCRNKGGHLPVIYSYDVNKGVASYISQTFRAHWIGLSQDSSGGYNWADGLSAELSDGRWANLQPDMSHGSCVTADLLTTSNLWSFDWCYHTLPFVCQRAATVQGTFQCLDGVVIYDNMACDGEIHCPDGSDELIDCPSQCVEYITGLSGTISSGAYSADTTCFWIIEAPQGQKIQLQFTSFETEYRLDVVDVFVGGSTLGTSTPAASLSGALTDLPTVYSINNFMILRLSTDQDENYAGFAASWTTDFLCNMAELAGYMQEASTLAGPTATTAALCSSGCLSDIDCMAAIHDGTSCTTFSRIEPRTHDLSYTYFAKLCPGTDSEITLTNGTFPNNGGTFQPRDSVITIASPFYPVMYPNGLDMHWYLHAPDHLFLTIETVEIDLTEDDTLVIYNGNTTNSDVVFTFNSSTQGVDPWQEMYRFIIPTGNEAFIHFRSNTFNPGSGFQFTVYPGCKADLTRSYGYMFTPNTQVVSVANYSTVEDCEFKMTPPSGDADITIVFTDFDVDPTDSVKILDAPASVLHTLNNDASQAEVVFSQGAGQASLRFTSDAVYTAAGFVAEYSHGCSVVSVLTGTNAVDVSSGATGSSVGRSSGDGFDLYCDAGYQYTQESLIGVSDNFTFVCSQGQWADVSGTVDFVPDCSPIYCGSPYASVTDGYVTSLTSVVTEGVATFGCADGYYVNYPSATYSSDCVNGAWENVPTCDAGSCPALSEVASATNMTLALDGQQQGSVIEITCDLGYSMVGSGRLLCATDGTWSEVAAPSCELTQCIVPDFLNGAPSPAQATVLNGESVSVACDEGYELQGSAVLQCGINGTYDAILPSCVDINECLTNNGGCDGACINTRGGFNCSCDGPEYVVINATTCEDYDECSGPSHYCDDECLNSVGSYSCICNEFGYEILPDGGRLASGEDGLESWNLYRINQTCTPSIFCSAPVVVTNGVLIPSHASYYYGERARVLCNLGYESTVTQGSATSTAALVDVYCNQGGGWTLSGEVDDDTDISFDNVCQIIDCPGLNLGSLINAPVPIPSGPIPYGSEVTLTCTVPGQGTFNRTRTCEYNPNSDAYELLGDQLECGVIDCGILNATDFPGSDIDTTFSGSQGTTYGDTFTFGCLNNLVVLGQSQLGGDVVTCQATGLWDLGSLYCGLSYCSDPGTPAGATQTVGGDGYVRDATVTMSCDGQDFVFLETGTSPVTLTCVAGAGSTSEWDQAVTACIDATNPVADCPQTTFYLAPMAVFNPESFNATDNSGLVTSYNYSHPDDTLLAATIFPGMAVNTITSLFTWWPTDGSANEGTTCDVQVIPMTYGTVTWTSRCASLVLALDDLADNTTVAVDKSLLGYGIATEADYTVTIDPSSVEVSAATLDIQTLVTIGVTHTDPAVLASDTCVLSLTVKPEICREFALRTPGDGNKTCTTSGSTKTCNMTCDPGYSFVVYSATTLTYTCEDGISDWQHDGNFTTYVPDCAGGGSGLSYILQIGLQYENYVSGDCGATMQSDLEALDFTTNANANCNNLVAANPSLANTIQASVIPTGSNAAVMMDVAFHSGSDWTALESCAIFVESAMNSDPTVVFQGIFSSSCAPTLTGGAAGYTSSRPGLECAAGLQLENYGCYPCPAGTFLNGTTCSYCPVGEYQALPGQTSCDSCPSGYTTETVGAVELTDCLEECPAGWSSLTGLAPCDPCPLDTYWTSATNCTNCPGSNTTAGQQAATSIADCFDLCPVGTYSHTTYSPCTPCPAGYHNDAEGSQICLPCSAGDYTPSTGATSSSECTAVRSAVCDRTYCSSNGECHIGSSAPALYCQCDPGYLGYFCEIGPLDFCDSNPCFNGATCSHTAGSGAVTCSCALGFAGDFCEQDTTDDCATSPCGVLNMCHDTLVGHECFCNNISSIYYNGASCENSADVCSMAGQECLNSAVCTLYPASDGSRRYCNCSEGFEGPQCETDIDECGLYDEPCYGRGSCADSINGFTCACETGYSGDRCEVVDDLCVPDPCGGFGQCFSDAVQGLPTCSCDPGYGETIWTEWTSEHNGTGGDVHFSFYQYGVIDGVILEDLYQSGIPIAMECREVGTNISWWNLGDDLQVPCVFDGVLYCRADQQADGACANYEVRYLIENLFTANCSNFDDCSVNQCLNGGTCADDIGGVTCTCAAGFEGALCQHDINGCFGDPCLNGATCQDITGGYVCQCAPGYEGLRCDVDTDDCSPSPCDVTGTDTCTDLLDGYTCSCLPGYTGELCQFDVDECLSEPCWNNGTCVDDVNGYTCTCAAGWEGTFCDVITATCTALTCQNSGVCYDLYGGFFCACPSGTRGTTCETTVDVCADADPCVNGGTCSYAGGVASCACPSGYTGSGCQYMTDACAPGVCGNGGTCDEQVDGFLCTCAPGFEGTNCETNTDECASITCVDGQCIDAVNYAYCYCDTRQLAGLYCQKPIDIDYDLEFRFGAMTSLMRPFVLWEDGNELEDITFITWIFYAEDGGLGTSACLHDAGSLTDPQIGAPVFCFDDVGVTLSINNDIVQIDSTVNAGSLASVNNAQWHRVAVTWKPATGSIKLFVDNFEAASTTYQTGNSNLLPKIATITLGDGQFRGQIHRPIILNSTMTAGAISTEPDVSTIVQDWEGYRLGEGVLRIQPSSAAIGSPVPAYLGPVVATCPAYASTYCDDAGSELTWTSPTFTGAITTVNNYDPGNLCTKGAFDIVYIGEDAEGGAALCGFSGYVKLSNCSSPYEGSMTISSCTMNSDISSSCEVSCPSGMAFLRPGPNLFTCGPSGAWDPENPFIDFILPSCASLENSPTLNLIFGWDVHIVSVATNTMLLLGNQVKSAFTTWATTHPYADGLCVDSSCSNAAVTPTITDVTNSYVTVVVTVTGVPSIVGSANNVLPSEAVKQGALQDDAFLIATIADANVIIYGTFFVEEELICSAGYQKVDGDCLSCTAGTYYDSSSQSCIDCSIGTYQNAVMQTSCSPCSAGETTARAASTDAADCYANCSAGYYYSSSGGSCSPCGRGFYQSEAGQSYCLECGFDMATIYDNATSCNECYTECPDGYEPDVANGYVCVACPVGEYRTAASTALCLPCPSGFETPGNASVSSSDCSLVTCPDGEYRVGSNPGVCQPCPLNSYRAGSMSMDQCQLCGDPQYWNTRTTGNVDDTDCFQFCGAGEYLNGGQSGSCEACPLGTYQVGGEANWFVAACTACPGVSPETLQLGSTSQDNCTQTNCNIGQIVGSLDESTGIVSCIDCPEGTYQPNSDPQATQACVDCGTGFWTRGTARTSASDCERFCEDGSELVGVNCQFCDVGFYKNNTVDPFGNCLACPTNWTTYDVGAATADNCSLGYCVPGDFFNVTTNQCENCPFNSYQPEYAQTSCTACANGFVTYITGAKSVDDCLDANIMIHTMEVTLVYDYYSYNMAEVRIICEAIIIASGTPYLNFTVKTTVPGSIVVTADIIVDIRNTTQKQIVDAFMNDTAVVQLDISENPTVIECDFGTALKLDTMTCEPCPKGSYQNMTDVNLCRSCELGYSTVNSGSLLFDSCRWVCPAGQYSPDQVTCVNCPVGTYKTAEGAADCTPCPFSDQTTEQTGSTLLNQCIGDCLAGQFRENFRCSECPIGTYSTARNVYSCQQCPEDYSTSSTGADRASLCKDVCELDPNYCQNGGKCYFGDSGPTCDCVQPYTGDFCETRGEYESDTNLLIAAILGGICGFILLVFICLCCVYAARKRRRESETESETEEQSQAYYPMGISFPFDRLHRQNPFMYDDPWGAQGRMALRMPSQEAFRTTEQFMWTAQDAQSQRSLDQRSDYYASDYPTTQHPTTRYTGRYQGRDNTAYRFSDR